MSRNNLRSLLDIEKATSLGFKNGRRKSDVAQPHSFFFPCPCRARLSDRNSRFFAIQSFLMTCVGSEALRLAQAVRRLVLLESCEAPRMSTVKLSTLL